MKAKQILRSFTALMLMGLLAQEAEAYQKVPISVAVGGKTREMVVFTPDNVTDNLPLMIVTHGMNQSPEYQYDADKMYLMVDDEQFIVAYLRSIGNTWDINGTQDQRFVEKSIAQLYSRYNIDPHRVYWSGFSMGSMLIYHCIHQMQGKIAAFAPTSGVQFSEQPWTKCQRPVNLIHCHAYADDVFNYSQYGIHDYVENMAKMNGSTTYEKVEGYNPGGWFDGDKEVWSNDEGNMVELFSYNNGGHWPQQANGYEIWNFCKQYSIADEDLDPIEADEAVTNYKVDPASEVTGDADKLDGRTLFVTDQQCMSMWYVNGALDSPQNVRSGSYGEIADNPYCWMKFHLVSNAGCSTQGNLYTIQMCDQFGGNYTLWGSDGYFNTPPGAWCLFALGLGDNYGQDAPYCGLWKVDFEEGHGYTMLNVGVSESGGNAWACPAYETPQAEKSYLRMFTKLVKDDGDSISQLPAETAASRSFDLMGREVREPRRGTIIVRDSQKMIIR